VDRPTDEERDVSRQTETLVDKLSALKSSINSMYSFPEGNVCGKQNQNSCVSENVNLFSSIEIGIKLGCGRVKPGRFLVFISVRG
jgi:hypothetical protein